MRTVITVLIILAVLVGGFFAVRAYIDQRNADATSNYQTVTASRGNLTATVGATGVVRANQTAMLSWQTTGTVAEVLVQEGAAVEKDQTLASIEPTTLPQTVILAQADLTKAQNDLDTLQNTNTPFAQASQTLAAAQQSVIDAQRAIEVFDEKTYKDDLEKARQDIVDAQDKLDQAQKDFDPYKDWDPQNETRKQFEDKLTEAQNNYNEAVRKLNELELKKQNAQVALDLANAQLADAQREYDRLKNGPDPDDVASLQARIDAAQASINTASLKAPFAGTLSDVQVDPGDQAAPGEPVFRIDDLSHLLVDVEISEVDIIRVSLGQPATLTFDAIPNKDYHGTVTQVAPVGSSVQGTVQFLVTVELTDADQDVRPGMTAAVNITVQELDNVLLVPNRAVRVQDGQRIVYVLRSGKLEQVPVTLGASSDTDSQVTDGGLNNGDAIVLNPPTSFENGNFFGR